MLALCSKLAYYAGIMLNALACLLCLKLCQHNRRRPNAVIRKEMSLEEANLCSHMALTTKVLIQINIPLTEDALNISKPSQLKLSIQKKLEAV